jgi:hypothetical protein
MALKISAPRISRNNSKKIRIKREETVLKISAPRICFEDISG